MPFTFSSLIPSTRIIRDAVTLGLIAGTCLPTLHGQAIIDKDDKDKRKGAFPTLSILPEGSILRRVRLPRYDKNFNPTSLLAAEQLLVLGKNRIEGEGVTIELYEPDGSLQARSKMRRAIYDQEKSTLHAREAIYLKGKTFVASGSGLIFHWESKKGFLDGPTSTRFTYQKKDNAMNTSFLSPRDRPLQTCVALGAYLAMSTSLIAEAPIGLTAGDLAKLEKLSKTRSPEATTTRNITEDSISKQNELSKKADSQIQPFLKSIGKGTLLIQSPADPAPEPAAQLKPPAEPAAEKPELKPGESTLLIECDGGLYFDNDSGVLVYMKNIRLTEDRFKLTCSDELKVFLSQDEKEAAKPESPEAEQPGEDKKNDSQLSSFGSLKQIIATGEVKLTQLDEQGRPFIAMAETASYEATTGEIILRGGRPRLQQSANQFLQAQEPGQWVKVLKSGKLVTSRGKWKMVAVITKP
ncbi:MAG: hypothetical protein AB8F34_08640 [Akkermansiaceae bacterium]